MLRAEPRPQSPALPQSTLYRPKEIRPPMNYILDNLNAAEAIQINGGPVLTEFETLDDGGIGFIWTDDDGQRASEYVNAEELNKARVSGHSITLTNTLNETIRVDLFRLTPSPILLRIDEQSITRFLAEHLERHPNDENPLIEALDERVHDLIGGYRATRTNNRGPVYQVMELAAHGHENEAIDAVAQALTLAFDQVNSAVRRSPESPDSPDSPKAA